MAKTKVDAMWEDLHNKGYFQKDKATFDKYFYAPGEQGYKNRKALYDDLHTKGYLQSPTYEDFAQSIGLHAVNKGGTKAAKPAPGPQYAPTDMDPASRIANDMRRRRDERAGVSSLPDGGAPKPLDKKQAGRQIRQNQRDIERQQKQQQKEVARQQKYTEQRMKDLPGGMERIEDRVNEYLATGEASPEALAPNPEVVRGDMQFDNEGKLQQSYMAPDGDYSSRAGAEAAEYRNAHPLEDELQQAYLERDRLQQELNRAGSRVYDRTVGSGAAFMPAGAQGAAMQSDPEFGMLSSAYHQNEMRIKALERERDATGFWRTLGKELFSLDTWDFGAQELMDAGNLLTFGEGDNLTPEQQEARESMLLNTFKRQNAEQQYGDNDTFMQRAATITANAIPFVVQFLATGGMETVTSGGAKLGGKMASAAAARGVTNKVAQWMLKNTGVLAGDIAAGFVMANTVGGMATAADIMGRHQGQVVQGPDGTFRFEGGKDWDRAIYEGEVANTLEYYTEMLGAHLDGASGAIGAWFAGTKLGKKIGIGELSKVFTRVKGSEIYNATTHMLRRGGFNEYPSEVFEEEANLILNSLLVGDNQFSDLADGKTQLDIWGGMLLSVGFMQSPGVIGGSAQAAQYYRYKQNTDIASEVAASRLGGSRWANLKEGLDDSSNDEIMDIVQVVMADESLIDDDKRAVMNYVSNLIKMRGYNLRTMADAKDKVDEQEEQDDEPADTNDSFHEGYNAPAEEQVKINDRAKIAGQRLQALGYSEEDMAALDDGDWDTAWLKTLPDNERIAVLDYVNAGAAREGMIQHERDNIDLAVADSDAMIDGRTHKDGTIIEVGMKNGGQAFVWDGNVARNADGSVDTDNSSSDLIIVDAESGERQMVSINDIASVEEPLDANQLKAEAAEEIRQTMSQAAADRIDGTVAIGQTYQIPLGDGQLHDVMVLDSADNNNYLVQIDGAQEAVPMSKADLQDAVDQVRMSVDPAASVPVEEPVQSTGQQDTTAPTDVNETAPAEQEERFEMPTDEQGEPVWTQSTPEQGFDFLVNSGLSAEDIASMIDAQQAAADKAIEAASKGGSINERLAARQAKSYWDAVKALQDAAVAPEVTAPVAENEMQPVNEPEGPQMSDNGPEVSEPAETEPAVETPKISSAEERKERREKAEAERKARMEKQKAERAEARMKALRERVARWVDALGVDVVVCESVDDVTNQAVIDAINAGENVKAWFIPETGKVAVYMPNIRNGHDLDVQLLHEVVAHHGMRKLFGDAALMKMDKADADKIRKDPNAYKNYCEEQYGKFCDRVYNEVMTEEERARWKEYPGVNGDARAAADEFMANMINRAGGLRGRERTRLQKILDWFRGVIENLLRDVNKTADERHTLTRGDLMDLLNASMANLAETRNREIGREISTTLDGALEVNGRRRRKDVPIRYSSTSIAEGGGFKAVEDDGEGNVGFVIGDTVYNGNNPIPVEAVKNAENSPLNLILKQALELGTVKEEDTEKIYNDYTELLNRMLEKGLKKNGGFLNLAGQWRWVADTVFRSVHKNSDDQYTTSLDITTICKKNEAVINAISEMQRQQGYGVTPNQILHLYENTYKEGYQTPCPVCYVFSHYLTNGRHASIIINGWRKYGKKMGDPSAMGVSDRSSRIKFFTDEYRKAVKWNEDNKAAINQAKDDIQHIEDDIDELGKQILKGGMSKKEEAAIRRQITALDKRYRAAVNLVAKASLDKWIKCFALEVKENDIGNRLREDSWRAVPDEMALDFRMTAESLTYNPGVQRLRSSDGSAGGKYIHGASNNEMGEVLSMLGLANVDKRDAVNQWLEASRATNEKDRESWLDSAKTRFENALAYMRKQSLRGGQRMWSWSDNIEALAPDVYINLLQMQLLGGTLQSYSKQLEGINLVARLGGYVNGSLMGLGKGYRELDETQVDKDTMTLKGDITEEIYDNRFKRMRPRVIARDGAAVYSQDGKYYTLVYDDVVGISPFDQPQLDKGTGEPTGRMLKGLFTLNKSLDKAGNILVGMNDMHNLIAMADPDVYFIIPYHKSSLSAHMLTSMYGLLEVEFKERDAQNYEGYQDDTFIGEDQEVLEPLQQVWDTHNYEDRYDCGIEGGIPSGMNGKLSPQQLEYRALRNAIFMDKALEADAERMDKINNDEFLKQVYQAVRGFGDGKPGLMQTADTKSIYPYEYWDETSTIKNADVNGERYLEYCRRMGVRPKFCGMKSNGKLEKDAHGNFIDAKGYWKTLIDRRMYDVKGDYQGLTPVNTNGFSVDLVDPKVTENEFPVTRVADEQGTRNIVAATIEQEREIMGDDVVVDYDASADKALEKYKKALDDSKKKGVLFSVEGGVVNATDETDMTDEDEEDIIGLTEDTGAEFGDAPVRFSIMRDPLEIAAVESDMLVNGYDVYYRAMSKLEDGLHQPMASMEDGVLREPVPEGAIERSDELDIDSYITPEIRQQMDDLEKNGKKGQYVDIIPGKLRYYWGKKGCKMKFHLVRPKVNGKGYDDLWAAYNPYLHMSDTPLNDQFSSAWRRPELVVVRVLVPKSEEIVGEPARAKWAKDHPGKTKWKSGVVNSQLPPKQRRNVMLSRYAKIDGIVPVEEAVAMYADKLLEHDVTVPFNTVTPAERDALHAMGVKIGPPEPNMGEACTKAYEQWKSEHPEPGGGKRFSVSETSRDKDGNEVYTETREDGTLDRKITTFGDGSKQALWYDEKGYLEQRLDYYPNGEVKQVANYDSDGNLTRQIKYDENRRAISHYEPRIGTDWERDENGIARGRSNGVEMRPYGSRFSVADTTGEKFKNWFGDWENDPENASKVVDKEGKPLVVYHQTNAKRWINRETGEDWEKLDWRKKMEWENKSQEEWEDAWEEQDFYTFDDRYARQSIEMPAIFFSPENDPHHEYGNRTIAVYLNMRNPAINPDIPNRGVTDTAGRDAMEALKGQGYDGFIRTDEDGNILEYGVFNPTQIKSATENNGEYDPNNPDIRFSVDESVRKAEAETDTEPSDAQKESGNYRKGHVKVDGFDVTIENPKGSVRSGTDAKGNRWSTKMHNTYGYFRGTQSVDGDHIDVFLSDHLDDWNGKVFVVDQVNNDGIFDEHKVMYGFNTEEEARNAYLSNYSPGWKGLGTITGVDREEFKKWVDSSHRKTKPFAEYKNVRFSVEDNAGTAGAHGTTVPTFYSNAERAVENVKQNKATAEQWKAMLTKAGGIKAGEDKWMGLSEWLDENKGKSLTKDEVLQFVRDNGIRVEEVNYEELEDRKKLLTQNEDGSYGVKGHPEYSIKKEWDPLDHGYTYYLKKDGKVLKRHRGIQLIIDAIETDLGKAIPKRPNSTRLDYTTEGLKNKREIAFVVPGVEPYQEHDDIHFGPENQGRAIMWVRFGETTDTEGNRVLVIDEIQSNRHQDAREKGYADHKAVKAFNDWMDAKAKEFGVQPYQVEARLSDEEYHKMMELANAAKYDEGAVPAAPFERNWQEVAMKRMLRLAAEEGFDKVAWTTGMQQAERYDLSKAVNRIGCDPEDDGSHSVFVTMQNGYIYEMVVKTDGAIDAPEYGLFDKKNVHDVFGKEIGDRILNAEDSFEITGNDLRIGGEGMKGFYDQMLPRFMDKYGKRWGVKVGKVTLDTPGRETMHSVDVNDDMRKSVMENGQPLFSIDGASARDQAIARDTYEKMLQRSGYQFQEAVQDSMLSLKRLYQAILGRKTRIEDVPDNENAYMAENHMSSINAAEQHEYFTHYMKPLLQAVHKIAGKDEKARQALVNYMMAKHGLERNLVLADRDAQEAAANGGNYQDAYDANRQRDYAGLTALMEVDDVQVAEAMAQQLVDDYEQQHDTTELWDRVKAATGETLYKMYSSGLMSRETYDKTVQMFEYYIPLRGWDETTSDEVYGYLTDKSGPLGSPIKHAKGRTSKADDPIATIALMADDTIRAGNRNLMKQRFLIFAQNHPSDLVSVNRLWLQYNEAADEWEPVFADIQADDSPEVVEQKVKDFEERMEQLANNEPDKYKRGRDAVNIPYKVVMDNLAEHQILVKRGGETYVLTINANPRAAQALNGMTNPDVKIDKGVVRGIYEVATRVNRELSAFYTTRNPDFIMSNFLRDTLYSNCMTWVKESPNYALKFHKNFGRFNPAVLFRLFQKWENGTLDMHNPTEAMFKQFMLNGGETGYTNVKDIEGHKRTIAKELKRQSSPVRKGWHLLGEEFDVLNRAVENCARFAAFVTSREMGRSIGRSVHDAKEVSVNFNKKGAGDKMFATNGENFWGKVGSFISGSGRLFYIFWNAGVQGMTNFGRAFKRNPKKAAAGAASMFLLGTAVSLLAQAMGGDDDDDKDYYYNLPENVRRSNICFRIGKGPWITIPLPIEFRAIYGLGEMVVGVITGKERYSKSELAYNIVSQLSQLMPLDLTEGEGGWANLLPQVAKTPAELMTNRTWYGMPIYKDTPFNKEDPEWTKAYSNANQTIVAVTKWLNEATGGNDYKKGWLDINPAQVEYALKSYFGGVSTTIDHLMKSFSAAFGEGEFNWRDAPLASRVLRHGDERTAFRKAKNEYFNFKAEAEETKRLLNDYQKDTADPLKYAQLLDMLHYSPEYGRYLVFEAYNERIEDLRKAQKESPSTELEQSENEAIRDLVDAMHKYDDSALGKAIAKKDKNALQVAFDSDSTLRKVAAKEVAKQQGLSGDKFGKDSQDDWSERTIRAHDTYRSKRNFFDASEDAIIESELKKAKDAKDKERAHTIEQINTELNKIRNGKNTTKTKDEVKGLGQGDDDRIMEELRAARRQVIEDLKNGDAEQAFKNLQQRTIRLGLRTKEYEKKD